MIYFSSFETLRAASVMLIFGTFFPPLVTCLSLFFKSLCNSLYFFKLAYNKNVNFQIIVAKFKAELKNKACVFFIDFISVSAFFIIFILLSYAFYDGIFRFYFLLIAIVSCSISKKFFKKAEVYLCTLISLILNFLLNLLSVFLLPIKLLLRLLRLLLNRTYIPLKRKFKAVFSRKHNAKKAKRKIKIFTKYIKRVH